MQAGGLLVESFLLEIAAVEALCHCSVVGTLQRRGEEGRVVKFLCDPVLKIVHEVVSVRVG